MNATKNYVRHGFGTVRPYLYSHPELFAFVRDVFGAEELERNETSSGFHIEVKIGDSVVVLEIGKSLTATTQASIYVYVPDVDVVYQRALHAGATSLREPADQPYGERNAGIKDCSGNTWWLGGCIE